MCLEKPSELLALLDPALEVFCLIRDQFQVPDQHRFDLTSEDGWSEDVATTAALTLHHVRRVRHQVTPGTKVEVTRVISTAAELHPMLTFLAKECPEVSTRSQLLQFREQLGIAVGAVIQAHIEGGGAYEHLV
jgi:hypothetical protein